MVFTAPSTYSENSKHIWETKYAKERPDGTKEESVEEIVGRVAHTIFPFEEEDDENYPDYHALYHGLIYQKFAFNSPVWFNFGVRDNPQGSACFILKVEDSFDGPNGIRAWWTNSNKIFKLGSGMGADLSNMREKGAYITGGGKSSGPLSFAHVADSIGQATASGGVTRRAATMLTMKDWHPDIEEFVREKRDIERLLHTCRESGYDTGLNSEIYNWVTGQQANRAIRLSDAFMEACEKDGDWKLNSPTDNKTVRTIKARELLRLVAECVWECGDPGVQFEDTIQKWHTLPGTDRINSSNPCSEYMSIDNSACNLASINLLAYYNTETKTFNLDNYVSDIRLLIRAMDRVVSISSYPTEEIERNTNKYRQLGLGVSNLGGLLMSMGIPYDSEEARNIAAGLMGLITCVGYLESSKLGGSSYMEYTPSDYNYWTEEKYEHTENKINCHATRQVVRRHLCALWSTHFSLCYQAYRNEFTEKLATKLSQVWTELQEVNRDGYYRNSQISVVAPTGTISFAMDCATTSAEPAFSLVYHKELVGGGFLKVPLTTVENGLKALGYDSDLIARIKFGITNSGSAVGYVHDDDLPVFATAVDPRGNSLSPEAHIKMCASLQPHVSGAISKTVNLPNNATVQDVERAIYQAHSSGLKAVTFYRDNSKATQPHTIQTDTNTEEETICPECGGDLVQTGTCKSCRSCGYGGVCS